MTKPSWDEIPVVVREAICKRLGSDVDISEPAQGGFGLAAVQLLTLSNGARVVVKAAESTKRDLRGADRHEELFYQDCSHHVRRFTPQLIAILQVHAWRVILLEDVGRTTIETGDLEGARFVARELAAMHGLTVRTALPTWLKNHRFDWMFDWRWLQAQNRLAHVALLSERVEEASTWLRRHVERLQITSELLRNLDSGACLVHRDVRSDNLRILDGRLKLLDWTTVSYSEPEIDIAFFAQTVATNSSLDPEYVIDAYRSVNSVRDDVLDAAVASLAAHYCVSASQSSTAQLSRLRSYQRGQLRITLTWASRRLRLPHPSWIDNLTE